MDKTARLIRDIDRIILLVDRQELDEAWTELKVKYAATPAKRIPAARKKLRRGKETRAEKEAVRREVYERDRHRCQIREHPACTGNELPWDGSVFTRFHAAHIKSEGAGGKFTPDNLRGACYACHIEWSHRGGKPCPKKAGAPQ